MHVHTQRLTPTNSKRKLSKSPIPKCSADTLGVGWGSPYVSPHAGEAIWGVRAILYPPELSRQISLGAPDLLAEGRIGWASGWLGEGVGWTVGVTSTLVTVPVSRGDVSFPVPPFSDVLAAARWLFVSRQPWMIDLTTGHWGQRCCQGRSCAYPPCLLWKQVEPTSLPSRQWKFTGPCHALLCLCSRKAMIRVLVNLHNRLVNSDEAQQQFGVVGSEAQRQLWLVELKAQCSAVLGAGVRSSASVLGGGTRSSEAVLGGGVRSSVTVTGWLVLLGRGILVTSTH